MIRLTIQDFQAVDLAEIEIGGLTVVLGPSNSGKSAIVRAFLSAITNQPPPGYVRRGAKFSRVVIDLDGDVILWEKGEGHSRYVVDGQTYEKTARSVPDAVRSKGIRPLVVGDASYDIQVAPQHVPLLLMGKGGGATLSSIVSSLSGLDPVVRAVRRAATDRQEAQRTAKASAEELDSLDRQLVPLQALDMVLPTVGKLRTGLGGADVLSAVVSWCDRTLDDLAEATRDAAYAVAGSIGLPGPPPVAILDEASWIGDQEPLLVAAQRESSYGAASTVVIPVVEDRGGDVGLLGGWLAEIAPLERAVGSLVDLQGISVPAIGGLGVLFEEASWLSGAVRDYDDARVDYGRAGDVAIPQAAALADLETEVAILDGWLSVVHTEGKAVRGALDQAEAEETRQRAAQEEIASILKRFPECPFCGTGLGHG